jgi:hypothetical protein
VVFAQLKILLRKAGERTEESHLEPHRAIPLRRTLLVTAGYAQFERITL